MLDLNELKTAVNNAPDLLTKEKQLKELCSYLYRINSKELIDFSKEIIKISSDRELILYAEFWLVYMQSDPDKEQQLIELLNRSNDYPSLKADIYIKLARISYKKGDFNSEINYARRALEFSEKCNYKYGIANAYSQIGVALDRLGNYKESLEFHNKAFKLKKEIGDEVGLASSYSHIASIYSSFSNYSEALNYNFLALEINEKYNNDSGIIIELTNIGVIYATIRNLDEAVKYFEKSIELSQKINDDIATARGLSNIGSCYFEEKNYQLSLKYHKASLEIKERIKDQHGIVWSLFSIAEVHLKLENLVEAKKMMDQGHRISSEMGSKEITLWEYTIMGQIAIKEVNNEEALNYFNKALNIAIEMGRADEEIICLKYISETYFVMQDYKNAYMFHLKFHEKDKEIFSEANSRQITSIKLSNEVRQKEKETEIERLKNIELKKAYEDLEQALKNLTAAQEELITKEKMAAIGKIASEIAHEVQNPLNFVNNFSELNKDIVKELVDEINLNGLSDYARELIKDMNNNSASININGKRAAGIVSQLLELTRQNKVQAE